MESFDGGSLPDDEHLDNSFGLDDDTIKTHMMSINQSLSSHRKQICLPKRFVSIFDCLISYTSVELLIEMKFIFIATKNKREINVFDEDVETDLRKSTDLELLHEYQLVIEDLEKIV